MFLAKFTTTFAAHYTRHFFQTPSRIGRCRLQTYGYQDLYGDFHGVLVS